jgi:molybdopterin-guanine dinucleotide biosynthesis protein A
LLARIFALAGGGKASRLGGIEKLNLDFSGTTLLNLILSRYLKTGLFDRVVILSGLKDPSALKTTFEVEYVRDIVEDGGPLIGLYSLLLNVDEKDEIFLHGGDMPFTVPELMELLYERFQQGYDVSVPESSRGFEPLFAWYRASVKPAVEEAVSGGKRRVVAFFDKVRVYRLDPSELKKYCNPDLFFFNINTMEDYTKALFLRENLCEKKD